MLEDFENLDDMDINRTQETITENITISAKEIPIIMN
jgi:hypothetical protein